MDTEKQLFYSPCRFILGGIRDRVTLRGTQSTYRRSFCPSGLPQSLRCRHTCMSLAYSHTRHSGRCQGRGHTR